MISRTRLLVSRWGKSGIVAAFIVTLSTVSAQGPTDLDDFSDPILLISAAGLEPLVEDPGLRIVDARDSKEYQEGHLPGAVNLPANSLVDPESRIRGNLSSESRIAGKIGLAGIGKNIHVVVYDDQGGRLAARLVWVLHSLGHPLVSVLSGGLTGWRAAGYPVTQELVQVRREAFPVDPAPRWVATVDWVLEHMHDPNVVMIDARPASLYEEDHIPGAINIPWDRSLNADGTWWKSGSELTEMFEAAGVTPDKNVMVYSEVGGMSALSYVILRALGYTRVRSYDRAWAEWSGDFTLPRSGTTNLPLEMVKGIFRASGCASCHMVSPEPTVKGVDFSDEGIRAGSMENGCIRLLTRIVESGQVDLEKLQSRLERQKIDETRSTFQQHGCVKCHDIDGQGATAANLSAIGVKYQGLKLGCLDMMFDLK